MNSSYNLENSISVKLLCTISNPPLIDPPDSLQQSIRRGPLSGLVGKLAILKADTHHWLTGAEYAALRHRLEAAHAAAEAALVVQRSTYQRSLIGCLDCETREEAGGQTRREYDGYRCRVAPHGQRFVRM
jgi:hypothetical protein